VLVWRSLILIAASALALDVVPRAAASQGGDDLFAGRLEAQDALAKTVAAAIDGPANGPEKGIVLGNERFEGEWALVSYQMTILGLGQVVLEHPELRDRYVPVMERAAALMMRPEQRGFATRAWGSDGLSPQALASARGDAWLGWPAVALSMLRLVHPETPFAADNDRITGALARRLQAAPHAIVETYPGESFPTDVAACAAAIALAARARGEARPAWMTPWLARYRAAWIDDKTGYLWQRGDARSGAHRDAPRGSGTAVAAYYFSFVDRDLTQTLTDGLSKNERTALGFAAIAEYPPGYSGSGDVDSGPVVAGVSVAATGFTLGAARATGRADLFAELYRTTSVFGVPVAHEGGVRFATGGPFGNAVMLAQLTAQRVP
jgi:hypothetical protein